MSTISKLIIVDDHPLFRKGLKDLISMDPSLMVAAEEASGQAGIEAVRNNPVDLVLLDMNMEEMDGLQTLRTLKKEFPDTKVVMLTVSDSEEDVVSALKCGADGYLLKDMEPEDILDSINDALENNLVVSEKLARLLAQALRGGRPSSPMDASLTDRELEIVKLIAKGLSNKQIGRKLDIAESTVKVHMRNLLKKLNLRSRIEVAIWAMDNLR